MEQTLHTVKVAVNWLLSRIAAVLLSVMTILVLIQVFTRYVLGSPTDWTEELVRYFLIWTGFIGAAYAFSARQHMALTLVRDRMSGAASKAIAVVIDVLILLFALAVIVIGGFQLAGAAMAELSALLGFSRGLVYLVAPISGIFIVLVQLINIYEDIVGHQVGAPEFNAEVTE